MIKVLLERVDWIEKAFINGQLTNKEVKYLLDEIDVLIDSRELEELCYELDQINIYIDSNRSPVVWNMQVRVYDLQLGTAIQYR